MEPDLLGEVAQVQEEVLVKAAVVVAEWGATDPGLAPVGSVFALAAVPGCHIKWECLATA